MATIKADKDISFETQPDWTLISQGAEARLHQIPNYLSLGDAVAKERFSKSYRHPLLDDRLTKHRCKAEAKCLVKCRRAGVPCPALYGVHPPVLYMEFVEGKTVREYIEEKACSTNGAAETLERLAINLGELIAQVHNVGVVHGDLTTSNLMISDAEKITLIDFGLSRISTNPEELAVDLYVLERAIQSTHPNLNASFLEQLLDSYKAKGTKSHAVLQRLSQVRLRGRKRECFG